MGVDLPQLNEKEELMVFLGTASLLSVMIMAIMFSSSIIPYAPMPESVQYLMLGLLISDACCLVLSIPALIKLVREGD
jgi:hypothetical protein